MQLPFYQVNAFTRELSGGNPAGVCVVSNWPAAARMQALAAATNFSEVAFLRPGAVSASIRWFSPKAEVDLCGHATLAAVHVLFQHLKTAKDKVRLEYNEGSIDARQHGRRLEIALPARPASECRVPDSLIEGLGGEPLEVLKAVDYLAVFQKESVVRHLQPNLRRLAQLRSRGVIVTAPSNETDFVSRYFAPALGIDEDHATGSSHCTLAPYWAEKLGKLTLSARQVSPRGGDLECALNGDLVRLRGEAVTFFEGVVHMP